MMGGSCHTALAADELRVARFIGKLRPFVPTGPAPRRVASCRCIGPRQRPHFLRWLLACALPTTAAISALAEEASAREAGSVAAVAAESEAARARAMAYSSAAVDGFPHLVAAIPETGATAEARNLPKATCGGADTASWTGSPEALDSTTGVAAGQRAASGIEKKGSDPVVGSLSATELRAMYLEAALREKLQAAERERPSGASTGGLKRLRPVSFTLRENHGGRNLSLSPLPSPLEPATPSLRSALSFLRSSLGGF